MCGDGWSHNSHVLSMDTVVPQWDLPGINLPTTTTNQTQLHNISENETGKLLRNTLYCELSTSPSHLNHVINQCLRAILAFLLWDTVAWRARLRNACPGTRWRRGDPWTRSGVVGNDGGALFRLRESVATPSTDSGYVNTLMTLI